jgi:hypothetical protein
VPITKTDLRRKTPAVHSAIVATIKFVLAHLFQVFLSIHKDFCAVSYTYSSFFAAVLTTFSLLQVNFLSVSLDYC